MPTYYTNLLWIYSDVFVLTLPHAGACLDSGTPLAPVESPYPL
jgi:hypothetical protein